MSEQGSRSEDRDQDRGQDQLAATSKLKSPALQTRPSNFYSLKPEATVEDYHTRCPPGLTPSQWRRIQHMRAQKMREEVARKERNEYFNTIQPMLLTKQE
jgi:hypothetical protein